VPKQLTAQSAFFSRRTEAVLFACVAVCVVTTGTLLAFLRSEALPKVSQRCLKFAERVASQRVIEKVYWRHRIWPKERPDGRRRLMQ